MVLVAEELDAVAPTVAEEQLVFEAPDAAGLVFEEQPVAAELAFEERCAALLVCHRRWIGPYSYELR